MSLSILKDLRRIYAGLNADEIRGDVHREVSVGLIVSNAAMRDQMERFLAPPGLDPGARAEALRTIHLIDGPTDRPFDFVLSESNARLPANGYVFDAANTEGLARAIASDCETGELALARNFPLLRKPVGDRIIQRVARENALFSLVTALPNVIPSFIDLPWAVGEFATDTAFLTMNQIRMALLLSGAYGRTVGYQEQKAQIAAIAAGAFGWRALARELVGKIPLGGGLIPKAAIAFAGTYVVGLGLEKVNQTGAGLSSREKKDAYAAAFAKGKEVVKELAPAAVIHRAGPGVETRTPDGGAINDVRSA